MWSSLSLLIFPGTLRLGVPVWVLSIAQIDLFKRDLYLIGLCVFEKTQKKLRKTYNNYTKTINMNV